MRKPSNARRRLLQALSLILLLGQVPASPPAGAASPEKIDVLVAWAPLNLPRRTERALERLRNVDATTVVSGVMWLKSSRDARGRVVQDPPGNLAVPIEVAFVSPGEYRHFVAEVDRPLIDALGPREAILASGAASLRRGAVSLRLGRHTRRVVGQAGDASTMGYEVLMKGPPPETFDRRLRHVLVRKADHVERSRIRDRIENLLQEGEPLRLASDDEARFLRYADSVPPLWVFKRRFGEFTALPSASGSISIRSSWIHKNITTGRVPILGRITCHRELFPPLRGALREVREAGLSGSIDPGDYAGCFVPRFVATVPGTRISRHSWGVAVDIDAAENPFGAQPRQDRRVVRIFERWGFAWGGHWVLPDGMHFEWERDR